MTQEMGPTRPGLGMVFTAMILILWPIARTWENLFLQMFIPHIMETINR